MRKILSIFIVFLTLIFSGCATTQLETKAKITRAIPLAPEVLNDKRVYLRITGTEASILDIRDALEFALQDRGVILVNDISEANINLNVNTLFANNLKEAANYRDMATMGVAGGILAKANGNTNGNSILVGVGVALAMGIADRALADETYRAIIDVSVGFKINNEWKKPEETRVIVEAVRMNLDTKEAKPLMEKKAVYQIAEILK